MEILIDVPHFLAPLLEWLGSWITYVHSHMHYIFEQAGASFNVVSASLEDILNLPRSVFLPIMGIMLVFWPVLLYLIMTLAAAWTWIFWLVTSIVFGLIQLVYVTYHFVMIACDIFGLSALKTYSMLRRQILHLSGPMRQTSRRRAWRKLVEHAGSYENFLKVRLLPKDEAAGSSSSSSGSNNNSTSGSGDDDDRCDDAALPPRLKILTRSNSADLLQRKQDIPHAIARTASYGHALDKHMPEKSKAVSDPIIQAVQEELGEMTTDLLMSTTLRLKEARKAAVQEASINGERGTTAASSAGALEYILSGVVKRNHLTLDDVLIGNARSIAESGRYGLCSKSRQLVRSYYEQVEKGLDWIAESPVYEKIETVDGYPLTRHSSITDRITLVRKMKQNMGRTALMLSGGGAQAMYHAGVIRAMIESKVYDDIKVISGTSGGSIIAGMCAIKTSSELYTEVCIPSVSTDYGGDGRMKREKISWFPPVTDMAANWFNKGLLMESKEFRRTCEFYYQNITFEEAFDRTGKHVCITVSASRARGGTAQRLLLNHISTPHVTISSAVAASCALPGVMAPAKLTSKNSNGVLEPFEVDGVEWIDGSVQADLPFQRIATMFAITSFIVSQTNFHVVPFLNKAHHPGQESLYWRLFQTMEWDIRNRALKLSTLGLFPRIFGQDISKMFKQKYHGNLTIVPKFTAMQTVGLKVLSDPSFKDMEQYLKYGEIAVWPYLNAVRDMIRLEKALDECLIRLEERARTLLPEWSNHDDLGSIASSANGALSNMSRVRILGRPPSALRDSERTQQKVSKLQNENQSLRQHVEELEKLLAEQGLSLPEPVVSKEVQEENEAVPTTTLKDGSEGVVWNLVQKSMTHEE